MRFKTNEKYQENIKIVQDILDRIKVGNKVNILFKGKEHLISNIEGSLNTQRALSFSFHGNSRSYIIPVDIATENLPFTIIKDDSLSLYRKFVQEDIDISYVKWLEKKVMVLYR